MANQSLENYNAKLRTQPVKTLSELLLQGGPRKDYRPYVQIVTEDGTSFGVGGGYRHYAALREDGRYQSLEVGFPSNLVEEFMPYIETGSGDPLETVYPWVPTQIVADVIVDRGGLAAVHVPGEEGPRRFLNKRSDVPTRKLKSKLMR